MTDDRGVPYPLDPALERLREVARVAADAASEAERSVEARRARIDSGESDGSRAALLLELEETVARRTRGLAREAATMVVLLERAGGRLGGSAHEGRARAGGGAAGAANDREPSAGVRLLATQMAISGRSREEIARRLKEDFGVELTEASLGNLAVD